MTPFVVSIIFANLVPKDMFGEQSLSLLKTSNYTGGVHTPVYGAPRVNMCVSTLCVHSAQWWGTNTHYWLLIRF